MKRRIRKLAVKVKRADKTIFLGYGLAGVGGIIFLIFLCASTQRMILPVFMIFLGLMMMSAGATILEKKGILD